MNKKANDIRDAFKGITTITSKELVAYFRETDINATDVSVRQRISRYKRMGFLVSIRQGVYAIVDKPLYKPESDPFIQKLSKNFSAAYPEINYCIWSSAWLYNFMVHQPAHYFYLFETEQDMVESAFNLLKDNGLNAWLNPDEQTIQLYVMGQKNPVVVKPIISRSPVFKSQKSNLPMLEKILVDAYVEKKIFYFLQGQELSNIFNFAFGKYSIAWSRLLSYARRRGVGQEIGQYIKKNIKPQNAAFLND